MSEIKRNWRFAGGNMHELQLKIVSRIASRYHGRVSFSQCGEDMIVDFIFQSLGVWPITYLDVGANRPREFNNTYYFYIRGCRGANVEPDPALYEELVRSRPCDKNLRLGVAGKEEKGRPFFVMSTPTLNTFLESEARRYEASGRHRILRVDPVDVVTLHTIFQSHFNNVAPDFISIDVEGLDLEIISSINLDYYRPTVICAETLSFSEDRSERKLSEISDLLCARGYRKYADTYINTIFVDREKWVSRK